MPNYNSIYTGLQVDEYLGKASISVPQTRTVNSKALSSDITLTASDVGALDATTVPYETGTWTPTLYGSTTAGSPTYNPNTQGSYTRIGNIALIKYSVWITAKGGMSGNIKLGGIPFASQSVGNNAAIAGYVSGVSSTYANYNVGVQTGGGSFSILLNNAVSTLNMTDAMIGDTFLMFGQIFMFV